MTYRKTQTLLSGQNLPAMLKSTCVKIATSLSNTLLGKNQTIHNEILHRFIPLLKENGGEDLIAIHLKYPESHYGKFQNVVICTGTSQKHITQLSKSLIFEAKSIRKELGLNFEANNTSDWCVVEQGEVTVHLMIPKIRRRREQELLGLDPKHDKLNKFNA